ncbi:PAS domain S-box protein [Salinadaptatus halalkaliphilus]|uniref:PAS domain S-box protein n=1 Tax=Salinadaptatus halalkaliphilus TaxID=2419781 RepID=A0A4S3THK8_9EURY|nr:bacterio-opsin activator domain-containing protein [Salinadaptatus halalkaliphilus]THE63494.1 PAS domain S-box protein [Salinadaptatus halalkaliphilus]
MAIGRTDTETTVLVVEREEQTAIAAATARARDAASIDTVQSVSNVETALETLDERPVDCLCTAATLADGSGFDLLEAVTGPDRHCPVVFVPEDGTESLASEAVAAGASEYVSRDRPAGDLADAIERAIATGRRRRDRTERARQFGAVFDDAESYAWVLEPDGSVRRANDVALTAIDATAGDVRGRPFVDLPWWDGIEADGPLRTALERAAGGNVARSEVTADCDHRSDTPRTLEVTVRPVRDDAGTIVSLLARATDITDRAELEAELRASEELHRVTLNNMTDTVLITDDEGAFTYVCPNVHFIFGYDDEEIYEMGSIDDLLGPDLFDREELAADGVLTNIECTATDKAGREHTLLVNVREVSIQDGTILYSCRDVTMRKRRDDALTALHRTARELLYAETDREIATVVTDDAADILDCDASGVYLFDTDENVLRPAAQSAGMNELHGPLSSHRAADATLPGDVYLEGENRFVTDLRSTDAFSNPTSDLRSAAFVPLGDHGVFLAGSDTVDAFDDVTKEVTDLLAATAEAALDRVERERRLRERDRELKRQNKRLTRLDQVNEIIREIDQALVRAETREEIEAAICDRLTADDRFDFAWIGAADTGSDLLELRAVSGTDEGREYLDAVSLEGDAAEPAVETARTGEVTVVGNVADGLHDQPWRSAALTREYQSVVSVPLSYDEFTYGVLTVYADRPGAFDEVSQTVLAELGETVASAIAAVERKRALLSSVSTRLEFTVADEQFVFTRLARRADCTVSFDGGVRQHEDGATVFVTVEGAPPESIVHAAADLLAVEDARVIDDGRSGDGGDGGADGGTVRLRFAPPFLALQLADHGVLLRRVEATPSGADVVVDVPSAVDARESADIVSNTFADVELRSKRRVERTTARDLRSALLDRLTDRQLEVIQLAYYSGYFETPRERSGEEIATMLDISPAAFYRHNRTVQRKLFAILFDELGLPASAA